MPRFELTRKQVELRNAAASSATHILAYGGGRSGKTFCFCYCIAVRALMAPGSRHLIARFHNIDVRQAVMRDTWPKMVRLSFPGVVYESNLQDQFITFPNGSEVWFGGLDDKDRVDKILGKEFVTVYVNEASQVSYDAVVTLRSRMAQNVNKVSDGEVVGPMALKAYYDLNPVSRNHWTHREFVEKVRPENGLPSTEPDDFSFVRLNPVDNPHLPAKTLAIYASMPDRQRKRFFEGDYLSEVPGALWSTDVIDALRRPRPKPSEMSRIVVAVDPSGSDGAGGDAQGIIVAGEGLDGHAYVIADRSCRKAPGAWAKVAVDAYHEFGADVMVAETNYGGAMVENTIRTIDSKVNFKAVTASRGKHVRAEPIAALYDPGEGREGRVHHVRDSDDPFAPNEFAALEEQMGLFTTAGYQGGGSPDRADALVWALTELMLNENGQGWIDYYREIAEQADAAREPIGVPVAVKAHDAPKAAPDVVIRVRLRAPLGADSLDLSTGRSYAVDAERCVSVLAEDVDMLLRAGCARL